MNTYRVISGLCILLTYLLTYLLTSSRLWVFVTVKMRQGKEGDA
jgi:hypothetical protein